MIIHNKRKIDCAIEQNTIQMSGCVAAHHFLVRGEADSHPAVRVCTHLVLHIRPNAAITQEVVTRLCVATRLSISANE